MANGNEDIGILDNLPDQTPAADVPRGTPQVGTDRAIPEILANLPDTAADPNAVLGLRGAPSEADMDATHRNFLAFGIDPSVYNNVKSDFDHQSKLHPNGVSVLNITDLKLNARADQHAADPSIPVIRRGQPLTKWQKTRLWFEDQFGITAKRQLDFEAQREGLTPEELADRVGANNVRLDRYLKFDPAAGAAGVLEGVAGGLEWLTDGEIGGDFANQMQILRDEMSPVDPNFLDQVSQGAGSMAMFFIPGLGVGSGVTRIFATAPRVANILGASTMTGLEAMTEAGLVWRDVFRKTNDQEQADKAANATFWLNVPLLFVTNKLGIFAEGGNNLGRFIRSAGLEGTQEAGQEIISASQTGEEIKFKDLATAFGVGAIIGGGAGVITGTLQEAQPEPTEAPVSPPTPLEVAPEQAELTEEGVPPASEAVSQGKEPSVAESATETAEIAQDTAINEPVEQVVATDPERLQELIASELTDEQIVEELTREPAPITPEAAVAITRAPEEAPTPTPTVEELEGRPFTLEERVRIAAEAAVPLPTEELRARELIDEQVFRALRERAPAKSLIEVLREDPEARAAEVERGVELLRETGQINLQAEVALDVIRNRLQTFTENPADSIHDLLNIGRAIFDEGKVRLGEFTARMREVAGDAWEQVKDIARQAWEIVNNERGEIRIGPEGRPEFDVSDMMNDLLELVQFGEPGQRIFDEEGQFLGSVPSTYPEFMREQGWTKKQVETALTKALAGEPITENQAEIVMTALADVERRFYRQVIESKGDFVDFTEELADGELEKIIDKGVRDFAKTLNIKTPKAPTEAQILQEEIEKKSKVIDNLQRLLIDKNRTVLQLQQAVKDAKAATDEKTRTRLQARVDKLRAELREVKADRRKFLKKRARPTTKAQIRRATGQVAPEVPTVREDVAFKESLRQSVKAARQAFREGRTEGVTTEFERIAVLQEGRKAKQRQSEARKKLARRLKKLRKSKKANISVDYQRRINELIDTIDLKGRPTAKTLNKLVNLREWLETHQDKLDIPQARIDQLERLGKLSLAEMTDQEVKEIQDTVNTLVQLGKLKRGLKVKYDKQEQQKQLDELIASTNNVDPKDFDPDEPTKIQNFDRGIRQAYMNTLHSPRVADMVDGFQQFDGPNAALIKDFARGESIAKLNTKALISEAMEKVAEETGISEMDEDQQTRIMIHIRLREGAFDQAKTLMEQNNMKEVPELSAQEEKLIEIIQDATNRFTDQIAATVEEIDNQPFNRLETYILPIKYEKEFNIAGPEMINQTRHRTTRPIQGFKFERVKGVTRTPRTDIWGIFEEAISEQQWYLNMQPRLEHARQLVLTEEYAEAAGDLMTNWWAEELDQIARRGWSAKAQAQPALRQVRLNLNQAILGYKLSSILMQPFAIFDAMAYMTNKYGLTSSQDIIREFAKAWVNPKYAESIIQDSQTLPNRRAGEVAVEEVLDKLGEAKTLREKFIKSGLSLLQEADIRTAAGVRQGILKALEKRGIENAADEADFLMNMVSGSSEVSLRPQVLGQGELARTYFTFQSFMLNRWGIIANDIIAGGLLKKGQTWKGRYNAMLALAIFIAAGATEDEAREFVFELTTGKELPDSDAVADAMLSLVATIPVLGNIIEGTVRRRSVSPPAIRTAEQLVGGLKAVATGERPETRLRGALRASEAALAITAGIPGTAQAFDFAEGIMIPEKRR